MENYESIEEHLSNIEQKKYLQFDFPILKNEQSQLIHNISDEIKHHRYLPFIRTDIIFQKYSATTKCVKPKVRKLTLPSHHDAFIYQYFGYQLSKRYEECVKNTCIDESAVAYRLNKHVSNITVAKEVVDFITNSNGCWIIKGDFKSFFDTLDHSILASNLAALLGNNYDNSYKRMLRSVTKYRYITRKTLKKQLKDSGIDKYYVRKSGRAYVKNLKQFGDLIKNKEIRLSSPNKKGIPQGTAVSAVLANIYMYEFDLWLSSIAKQNNGIYRRYSDDFIVIIPASKDKEELITRLKDEIIKYSRDNIHLKIEPHKTQLLLYSKEDNKILKLMGNTYRPYSLAYLGFCFDGISVSLRPKSIYKFVYRSKRSINRYIAFMDARERYLSSKGPSICVKKFNKKGVKTFRIANPTEKYRKRELYKKAGTMNSRRVFRYRKDVIKRLLAITKIEPRSSMMSYARKAQRLFQYGTHGKYKVVILRQVVRQISRNQKKVGASLRK